MSSNWVDQDAKHHAETAAKREAQSIHESEQTEKTLHHLAGRVEELRAQRHKAVRQQRQSRL